MKINKRISMMVAYMELGDYINEMNTLMRNKHIDLAQQLSPKVKIALEHLRMVLGEIEHE